MEIDAKKIERRLTALETEVAELKSQKQNLPWWEKIVGVFENDEDFDNAMKLGREYRESLRPNGKNQKK
jgi:hypothetical protein